MKSRNWLANAVIVGFLGLAIIETLPIPGSTWQRLRDAVDPVLDACGLWQGTWDLFSPRVDRQNHHIEIIGHYGDEETHSWRSSDWKSLNCWQVFLRVREVEYYDRVRGSSNEAAWPGLASEAARRRVPAEYGGRPLESVELIEVSRKVPSPGQATGNDEDRRHTFYRQSLRP